MNRSLKLVLFVILASVIGDVVVRQIIWCWTEGYFDVLVQPSIKGKVMVIYNRCAPYDSLFHSNKIPYAGLMSEFHSVLGAIHYAEQHEAAGIRVVFDSPMYLDPNTGPNWWLYYFSPPVMWMHYHRQKYLHQPSQHPLSLENELQLAADVGEVHFNSYFSRFGRLGGFGRLIYGPKSHLYPMTYALSRMELFRILVDYVRLRESVAKIVHKHRQILVKAADFVLGVHYRGTDTSQHWPYYKLSYEEYCSEVNVVLRAAGFNPPAAAVEVVTRTLGPDLQKNVSFSLPVLHRSPNFSVTSYFTRPLHERNHLDFWPNRSRLHFSHHHQTKSSSFRLFIASDEIEFVTFMQQLYSIQNVVAYEGTPRLSKNQTEGIHFSDPGALQNGNKTHSKYNVGESVVVDGLLLAECDYIVKGRSGVSEFSLAFNPHMHYSVFLERGAIYRSSNPDVIPLTTRD